MTQYPYKRLRAGQWIRIGKLMLIFSCGEATGRLAFMHVAAWIA